MLSSKFTVCKNDMLNKKISIQFKAVMSFESWLFKDYLRAVIKRPSLFISPLRILDICFVTMSNLNSCNSLTFTMAILSIDLSKQNTHSEFHLLNEIFQPVSCI